MEGNVRLQIFHDLFNTFVSQRPIHILHYPKIPIYSSTIMQQTISSIPSLLQFFLTTYHHLFYTGPIVGTSLLTIHDFMPTFEILTCSDPFFGTVPHVKVMPSLKGHQCMNPFQCQDLVLKNPETLAYMKGKDPSPNVLYGFISPQSQEYCKQNGINVWTTTAALSQKLGSKVTIIETLEKAGIPHIPNICSKTESYAHLMSLGEKLNSNSLVVQDQEGAAGHGTMFIRNQQDYNANKEELQSGKAHKIMPYKKLRSFCLGGVITNSGTVLGPLLSEMIGHPKLTPFRGGYCGNQFSHSYYGDATIDGKIRKQMYAHAQSLGNYLNRQQGYRGVFGFDFVVDEDSHEVFFMEMNPRLTGSTTLTYQLYQAEGYRFPHLLFHCLEFLGVKIDIGIPKLNQAWVNLQNGDEEVSQLVMRPLKNDSQPYSFSAGIWKRQVGGSLVPTGSKEFRISLMKQGEIFFIPNRVMTNGTIIMRKRCQDPSGRLTEEAEELIDKFTEIRFNYKAND